MVEHQNFKTLLLRLPSTLANLQLNLRLPIYLTGSTVLRLVGGHDNSSGRVEIYFNGSYSTICDSRWGIQEARVVCKTLGFTAGVPIGGAAYGEGEGDIILEGLECLGNESSLLECRGRRLYKNQCTHRDDAGVQCFNTGRENVWILLLTFGYVN